MNKKLRVAANLNMLFKEAGGLLERYNAAGQAGFKYVETRNPYVEDANKVKRALNAWGMQQVLINSPRGNFDGGLRGFGCWPDKKQLFRESIDQAMEYADILDCNKIHVIGGLIPHGKTREQCVDTYLENINYAAEKFEKHGLFCLIEPLNEHTFPGCFLNTYISAVRYIDTLKKSNVKIQMDIYHMQLICGQLTERITALQPYFNHIQVAQAPRRHEPDSAGEINYKYIFDELKELNYEGFIGAEYDPSGGNNTLQSLQWIDKFGLSKS